MASNNSGVWNEAGDTLSFSIAPAYYQTRWFAAMVTLGIATLLWAAYQWRIRQLAHQFNRTLDARVSERTRIARDLHDDACQEVAGVAVEISNLLHRGGNIRDDNVQQALSTVHTRVASVAESLRLLSHDLHPSVLQHIGLVAALESHCAEVERQHDVQVRFSTSGVVEPITPTVALSLFRVAQEALRNAARHGHARHIRVTVARSDDQLALSVSDDGEGFDPAGVQRNSGLGLVSIEERVRLVKGHVTVRSEPRQGTAIDVRVPVNGANDPSERAGMTST